MKKTVIDSRKNVTLTKIQAAEKQVNTAIFLLFEEIDAVSTHTLVAGSYEILRAISQANKIEYKTFWNADTSFKKGLITDREEWIRFLSAAQNFFKHGSRDVNVELVFNPIFTHMMLYDSVILFQKVVDRESPEMLSYRLWFMAHYLLTMLEPNTPIEKFLLDLKKKYNPENLKDYATVLKLLKQNEYRLQHT